MTSLTLFSTFLLIIAATYSSPIPDNEPEKLAKVGNETLPISEQQAQKIKELIQSADVVQEIPISGELAETIQKLVKNQQVEEVAEESAEYETTEVLSSETAGNGTVIDGKSGPVRSYGPMGKPIKLMMPGAQGPVKRTQVIQTRYINGKPEFRVVTRTRRSGIDDVGSMISGGAKNIANIISGAVQTGADGWTALNQVAANVIGKAAVPVFGVVLGAWPALQTHGDVSRTDLSEVRNTDQKIFWPTSSQQTLTGQTHKKSVHYANNLKVEEAGHGRTPGTITDRNGDITEFIIPNDLKSQGYIPGIDPGSIVVVETARTGTTPGLVTNSNGEPLKIVLPPIEVDKLAEPHRIRHVYYKDTIHVEAAEPGTTAGTVTDDLGYIVKFLVPKDALQTPGYIRGLHGSAIEVGPAGPGTTPGLVTDAAGEPIKLYLPAEGRQQKEDTAAKTKRKPIRVVKVNVGGPGTLPKVIERDIETFELNIPPEAFKTPGYIPGKNGGSILVGTVGPGSTPGLVTDDDGSPVELYLPSTSSPRVLKKKTQPTHPVYIVPQGDCCTPGTVTDDDGDVVQFIVPPEAYESRGYIPGPDGRPIIAEPAKPGTTPGVETAEDGSPVHLYLPAWYRSEKTQHFKQLNVTEEITASQQIYEKQRLNNKASQDNDHTTQRFTSKLPTTQMQQSSTPNAKKETDNSELEIISWKHLVLIPEQGDTTDEAESNVTQDHSGETEDLSIPNTPEFSKTTTVYQEEHVLPRTEKVSSNHTNPHPKVSPKHLEDLKQVEDKEYLPETSHHNPKDDSPNHTDLQSSETTPTRTSPSSVTPSDRELQTLHNNPKDDSPNHTDSHSSETTPTRTSPSSRTPSDRELQTSQNNPKDDSPNHTDSHSSEATPTRASTSSGTTSDRELQNMKHSERPLRRVLIMAADPGTTPGVVTGSDGTIEKVYVPIGAFITPGFLPGRDGKTIHLEPVKPGSTPGLIKGPNGELETIVVYSTTTHAPK